MDVFDLLQIVDENTNLDLELIGDSDFMSLGYVGGDVITDGDEIDIVKRLRQIIHESGAGHELDV